MVINVFAFFANFLPIIISSLIYLFATTMSLSLQVNLIDFEKICVF